MLRHYENPFSPFARKTRLVLEHKGLAFKAEAGLDRDQHATLARVNGRLEVPVLEHDGVVVVNSSDIVAYLERVFPEQPVYPTDPVAFVKARAWERCADTTIDPILTDIGYWGWAERPDQMPDGLLQAARTDLAKIYAALDTALAGGPWVCGELSIADMALFVNLSAAYALQVPFDRHTHRNLAAWYRRCRETPLFAADIDRIKTYMQNPDALNVERKKLFWRGDRIEWILARGFHHWFMREIEEDRVLWPGLAVPAV